MQEDLRKLATIPLYILAFVIMGLVSGYLAFKILSFSKTVEVPDLRGQTLVEANTILSKEGLYLKVEGEEYDPVIVPGRIIRQDVPPGNKVKEQRGIKVFLSKGPRVWSVPELAGLTLEEAEQVASRNGLRLEKIIPVHSDSVEKEKVIAQRPNVDEPPGSGLPQSPRDFPGQRALSVVVSAGPYETIYYCPDFSGKSRDEALGLAEKLRVSIDFTGEGERVRSQKPRPNAVIRAGETLHLQLAGVPAL
ncbi:MAG: PASTA domain-containing protein [Nitrospirae bacterium]|nr:PASTA domain-containing protein [Nitrospirota bacterium]